MIATAKNKKYIETVGRRKEATARVRITPAEKESIVVNGVSHTAYFTIKRLSEAAASPLRIEVGKKFSVSAKIKGGGISAQAEALRHGIARALVSYDESMRGLLKKAGYLKRDPRAVERKKFGLKKARRAPQWSKR